MNGARRLRVLIVEDEMIIALMIEDMVIDLGHELASRALDCLGGKGGDTPALP